MQSTEKLQKNEENDSEQEQNAHNDTINAEHMLNFDTTLPVDYTMEFADPNSDPEDEQEAPILHTQ